MTLFCLKFSGDLSWHLENKSKSQVFWPGATSPTSSLLSCSSLSWLFFFFLLVGHASYVLPALSLLSTQISEIFAWLDRCLNLSSNVGSSERPYVTTSVELNKFSSGMNWEIGIVIYILIYIK